MALQDVFDAADAQFDTYWPDVEAAQEDYFASEGRYWQGLVTHGPPNVPHDGTAKAPDRLTDAPTDQPISWEDFKEDHGLSFPSSWEQALRIDSYHDETGHGYVAIRRLVYQGSEYKNQVDSGPLTRGHDWEEQPKPASDADAIAWEAGIFLEAGQKVTYSSTTYVTIQKHMTQSDWTPDVVPALFNVVPSGEEWQVGVAYDIDDVVLYNSTEYVCIQAHTSQEGWEPPNVPALWSTT